MSNRHRAIVPWAVGLLVVSVATAAQAADPPPPKALIGYTQFRTNLPASRHANVITMRARVVSADGSGNREPAPELARPDNTWTQFAGWSPDGTTAIIGCGWEDPENARWEEEHKTFRFTTGGWMYDVHTHDIATGETVNLTAVERVSPYNTGLFFWPNDPTKLGFQALIDGESHPFRMDRDGRNKQDLTGDSRGFAYGFNASPDGRRIAYHRDYQIYLADADGSHVQHIETGNPFNFVPQWSPDGRYLVFVSGEHYNCHPFVVRRDGEELRKIADRGRYRGVVEFLDVFDFHGGSSDVPTWTPDSQSVIFAKKIGEATQLVRATLDGEIEQLTHSPAGTLNYHPQVHPDGEWVLFGSNRSGTRQIYIMQLTTGLTRAVTNVPPGHAAMWPHWQPQRARNR